MLVGLVGPSGTGKTTAAKILVNKYGFARMSFAFPLKKCVSELFMWDLEKLDDLEFKETVDERWGVSPREVMQKFGTDFVREMIDADFWVKRMAEWLNATEHEKIVIDDIRFQNEANLIEDLGGKLIRVERSTEDKVWKAHHKSELVDIQGIDGEVVNNWDLQHLERSLISELLK